ncbi:MAG TPA: hypothetical protein VFQ01_08850 [Nocardioides sp.]|jgi:hypothetical protein|nr:hypothetical protein [Nocardioides sp.]
MTLTRITSTLGALALGGVLVASTYGAQAAGSTTAPDRSGTAQHSRVAGQTGHFQAPAPHRYGSNGMRMGLHCETHDAS